MASKDDLNLSKITDPTEQSEIQSISLLLDVTNNPVFAPSVIAQGEDFTDPVEGVTLSDATQSVSTGDKDPNIGPVVVAGTETDDIITTLQSDIAGYFNAISNITTADDVNRYFLGTPVVQESRLDIDVCVDDTTGDPLPDNPTLSYDQAAFNAALIAKLGPPGPRAVFNAPFVGKLPADFSTGEPVIPAAYSTITHPSGNPNATAGLRANIQKLYNQTINEVKVTNPPSKTCPVGSTYHERYEMNKFRFGKPHQLQENITITGLSYVDANGATGTVIDDTVPAPYTITYSYGDGDEFHALNSILTPAGKAALAGKSFNLSVLFTELGSAGSIQPPTTDSKNVIGAITELDESLGTTTAQAATVEESVWIGGVGDWRNSQSITMDDPNDPGTATINNPDFDIDSYNQVITINSEWNNMLAWRKLNLIPVLRKDKILVEKFVPNPDPALSGEQIRLLELDMNSQVTLLEATYSLWRHVSADMANTYGVDSIITPGASGDQLIQEIDSKSHVEIFNMLYTDLSGLSGDLATIQSSTTGDFTLIQQAISGSGDTLISNLSGNSIYNNLNTIYTGLTATQDCCETNTNNISALSASMDSTITTTISGVSGDTFLPDLTGNSIIKNINNIYTSISGTSGDTFVPGLTGDSIVKNINNIYTGLTANVECCETNTTSITALSTLVTNLTGGAGGEGLTNIQYAISGDGSDVLITNLSGDNIYENLNIMYYELSGFSECCDLIKTHLSGGDDTTITNQLSTLIENNAININVLSGCCDNNADAINMLKTIIYGPSQNDEFHTDLYNNSIITNINTLYTTLSGLVGAPLTGAPEAGEPDPWGNILNNTTNINKLFTDVTHLSATIDECCENQTTTLSAFSGNIVDLINDVQNEVTNIDTSVTTNITNITNSLSSYVDLTTNQIISGSKTFDDPTLIDAPLSAGDNVTIGTGNTIFNVCTDTSGNTEMIVNGLPVDGVNDINSLPINSVYITEINGHKVLAIKTS